MKKSLLFLAIIFITPQIHPEITTRIAELTDLQEILDIQAQFTKDDLSKLVVFPTQAREAIVKSYIEKRRLFVAIDTELGKIINVVKLFIIDSRKEFDEIVVDELRFKREDLSLLTKNNTNRISQKNSFKLLKEKGPLALDQELRSLLNFSSNCTYFYYGSAYTLPGYRGTGINGDTLKYALNEIGKDVLNDSDNQYVALLFGQIKANSQNKGMISAFSSFLIELKSKKSVLFQHITCQALLPTFVFNEETQEIFPIFTKTKERQGEGNAVFFKI